MNEIIDATSFDLDWRNNRKYFDMLVLMASLSKLFAEGNVPLLNYRVPENLFCKYFSHSVNQARACTAYDATLGNLGVGIKTFILKSGDTSKEKIAEFDKKAGELSGLSGMDLARKLAEFRNGRMRTANSLYGVTQSIYHIVGRKENNLTIFNSPYLEINENAIDIVEDKGSSLTFVDTSTNELYSFNRSKSVLMKKFNRPNVFIEREVQLIEDPYSILEQLLLGHTSLSMTPQDRRPYVILPLFSTRENKVPEKSGLNQWNAAGRPRDPNEVYIPIPAQIHNEFPDFFPPRDVPFNLHLPNGSVMSAKVCQDGGKALMSNPNRALGEWLLRGVLHLKEGTLLTMDHLNDAGFDCVVLYKNGAEDYSLDVCYSRRYDSEDN